MSSSAWLCGFPGGAVVSHLPADVGDASLGPKQRPSAILCTIAVILLSTFVDVGRGVRLAV